MNPGLEYRTPNLKYLETSKQFRSHAFSMSMVLGPEEIAEHSGSQNIRRNISLAQ